MANLPSPIRLIRQLVPALAGASLILSTSLSAQAESAFDANTQVVLPGWRLDFQPINPMVKFAPAYGDRNQGGHGTFGRFPPGFSAPWHIHTGAYHAVVISGVMSNPFRDEDAPPTMEPGSYWYVPAKVEHVTACVSDVPCVFYFYADHAFDFTPVE